MLWIRPTVPEIAQYRTGSGLCDAPALLLSHHSVDVVGTARHSSTQNSATGSLALSRSLSLSVCVCVVPEYTVQSACSNHAGSSLECACESVCVCVLYPCVYLYGSVVVIMPVKRQKLLACSSLGQDTQQEAPALEPLMSNLNYDVLEKRCVDCVVVLVVLS